MRTEELYYQDARLTAFTAKVLSCEADEKSRIFRAVLDRTAFFPEQGGQKADRGMLGGRRVLDVTIRGGVITHILDGALEAGETVSGEIDWERRFDFMQQHSGEHIFSGIVHRRFGCDNVGFHLSERETRLDFNAPISSEALREIEEEANRAIWSGLELRVFFPGQGELQTLSYRSKLELTEGVRIVEIPGVDRCACCAPHVRNTGEIGLLKLTGAANYKGGVRLTIACGMRALRDYRAKQERGEEISTLLSAPQEEIVSAVSSVREKLQRAESRAHGMGEELLRARAASLAPPESARHALLFVPEAPQDAMRRLVNEAAERYSGVAAVFSGNDGDGWRFVLGSCGVDCGALARRLRELGFRCGGGRAYLQGSAPGTERELRELFEAL